MGCLCSNAEILLGSVTLYDGVGKGALASQSLYAFVTTAPKSVPIKLSGRCGWKTSFAVALIF